MVNLFADFSKEYLVTSDAYLNTLALYNIALPEMPLLEYDIRRALNNVDPLKGTGPNRLSPILIKN